jgi:phosphonate transport system substrate-binding protein
MPGAWAVCARVFSRGFAALLLISTSTGWAAGAHLSFGVFPHLSARVMAETYQPLAHYLSESIKLPVNLESAPDFVTFSKRTAAGEYDLVLTAPHMALLAWNESGYRPILTYVEPAKGFVVVRADSPYRQLPELRGKTISIPDQSAVVIIRMEKILARAGLILGKELTVMEAGSHTNAAIHVGEKQADAAIVGVFPFLRLPRETRDNLRVIAETPDLPSLVFLVHSRIGSAREQAIRKAVEDFMLGEAGRVFLQKTGFGGVRPLRRGELQAVEGDAKELKRRFPMQEQAAGKAK